LTVTARPIPCEQEGQAGLRHRQLAATYGQRRKARVHERTREVQRLHTLLEDAGLELGWVALDVLGVSGRAVLEALVGGATDPAALSVLAWGERVPAIAVSSA
jgi:hypothetical protein